MRTFLLIYITLLLVGLTGTLGSLFWIGHLSHVASAGSVQIVRGPEPQVVEYQIVPASARELDSFHVSSIESAGLVGVHVILYTRVEADAQGKPVLRGYRLRLTWDEHTVPALGVSGSPLPLRDMAAPY